MQLLKNFFLTAKKSVLVLFLGLVFSQNLVQANLLSLIVGKLQKSEGPLAEIVKQAIPGGKLPVKKACTASAKVAKAGEKTEILAKESLGIEQDVDLTALAEENAVADSSLEQQFTNDVQEVLANSPVDLTLDSSSEQEIAPQEPGEPISLATPRSQFATQLNRKIELELAAQQVELSTEQAQELQDLEVGLGLGKIENCEELNLR